MNTTARSTTNVDSPSMVCIECWFVCAHLSSRTVTVSRDQAIEELRRGDGPTAVIIDVPLLEFDVINLLLSNDLLQASHWSFLCYWLV